MTAAARIHLMRHGAPVLAGRMLGRTDSAATPAGIEACRAAAETLTGITAIVSSDLCRAHASAEAAGKVLALPVGIDPRWREMNFGDWDGRRPDEIDPAALTRFWADPDAAAPPGGERWSLLCARIAAALSIVADGTLVVTHAGAMRAALGIVCGFDVRQVWAIDLPYAAVLTLSLWRDHTITGQITGLRA